MTKSELARSMYQDKENPHNCAQAVLCAFSEDFGVSQEEAMRMAARFGHGMGLGSSCGTISGGLMVLGLARADNALVGKFTSRFASAAGALRCPDLLIRAREAGEEQKDHCARMVTISASILEELLAG